MSRIPTGMNLVIDVSSHQKIDYALVSKYIKGAIIRVAYGIAVDTSFKQHYDGFMAQNIPCAAYQWYRPDQDVKQQIEVVRNTLADTKINLVLSDQEQHGQGPSSLAPIYPHDKLSEMCESHVTGIRLHGYELGTYSRSSWIMERCKPSIIKMSEYPAINPWRYDYWVWLASWPFASGALATTWEAIADSWAPTLMSPYFVSGWPYNLKYAHMWQWSGDKFILPGITTPYGVPRPVDLNYAPDFMVAKFLKKEIPVPPPIEPPTECQQLLDDTRLKLVALQMNCEQIKNSLQDIINNL